MKFPAAAAILLFAAAALANNPPNPPVIREPPVEGYTVHPEDLHMETAPFSDPDPGDTHRCSDWELWTVAPPVERIWSALCVNGISAVHIHLGDGTFEASHAGRISLFPSTAYTLRVRHRDSSNDPLTEWSPWSTRGFQTSALSAVFPLRLDDIATSPTPHLDDTSDNPVLLPGGPQPATITLDSPTGDLLLQLGGGATANLVTNPPTLPDHVPVRARITAGADPLFLPDTNLFYTDAHGADRAIYLPSINMPAGQTTWLWVTDNGSTYYGQPGQTQPVFTALARSTPAPWLLTEPGFKVEIVASGFTLPVNIAFVPSPGPNPTDPYFYVTELYGSIKVVRRDGSVGTYATGLLNFDPTAIFPGSGEQGVTGLCVDAATGDVFAGMLYDSLNQDNDHYPKVVRFHSTDGGQTAATQTIILDMPGEIQGQSHQISNMSFGPDGKLYVHMGDGFITETAQDLTSFRGKILRMNLDGSPATNNPFYNAANGITATDYIWVYGLRNPFGGGWRDADGAHYEVENGPTVDRFAKMVPGRNYLWNGTNDDMRLFALYNWDPSCAPVNIVFLQPSSFNGSGFPASKQGHAFVTQSGATWSTGYGKSIAEFVLDPAGNVINGPTDLALYNSVSGKGTCVGLAAGPDGLYFSDLYLNENWNAPNDPGASILRLRWVGIPDFKASVRTGIAPLSVQFTDTSDVPSPSAWQWTFGDGTTSTLQNPVHLYAQPGLYDVRLSVTGAAGSVAVQKPELINVARTPRVAMISSAWPPPAADHAVTDFLGDLGWQVFEFDDNPANRPTATEMANFYDALIVTGNAAGGNIGAEFHAEPIPMLFWNRALLAPGLEPLTNQAASLPSSSTLNLTNNTHPLTQGLATGALLFFNTASQMNVGRGTVAPGVTVLATRAAASTDYALMVAEPGAPLQSGYATPARRAFLCIGDATFPNLSPAGEDLFTRSLCWTFRGTPAVVTPPTPLTLSPGADAVFSIVGGGAGPLSFQWRKGGIALSNNAHYSGADTETLTISAVTAADNGSYDCLVSCPCGTLASPAATLTVAAPCYPNCDGSTQPPILNVADFTCFLQRFAAGDAYANCDGSTQPPVLNVADFTCFLQRFAAGCR